MGNVFDITRCGLPAIAELEGPFIEDCSIPLAPPPILVPPDAYMDMPEPPLFSYLDNVGFYGWTGAWWQWIGGAGGSSPPSAITLRVFTDEHPPPHGIEVTMPAGRFIGEVIGMAAGFCGASDWSFDPDLPRDPPGYIYYQNGNPSATPGIETVWEEVMPKNLETTEIRHADPSDFAGWPIDHPLEG